MIKYSFSVFSWIRNIPGSKPAAGKNGEFVCYLYTGITGRMSIIRLKTKHGLQLRLLSPIQKLYTFNLLILNKLFVYFLKYFTEVIFPDSLILIFH